MKCGRWIFLALLLLIPSFGHGQSVNIDLGAAGQAGATARLVQLTALVTVLSLAPSLRGDDHGVHPNCDRAVAAT